MKRHSAGFVTLMMLIVCTMITALSIVVLTSAFLVHRSARNALTISHIHSVGQALRVCCARVCIVLEKGNYAPGKYTFMCASWPWKTGKNVHATIVCELQGSSEYIVTASLQDDATVLAGMKGHILVAPGPVAYVQKWQRV